jgi:hypothetical protein
MPADDQPDEEFIAQLAYQLWESRGRPAGSAEQDWLEAKAMLAASKTGNATAGSIAPDTPAKMKTERRKSGARKTIREPKPKTPPE